jgi:hypothetical protein
VNKPSSNLLGGAIFSFISKYNSVAEIAPMVNKELIN